MSRLADIMEVCLLAGKVMLSYGGETYRVEDTMTRIAKSYHIKDAYSYVTPTGIFLTLQGEKKEDELTKFVRIFERSIDLNKVTMVNDISRRIVEGQISISDANLKLEEIAEEMYKTDQTNGFKLHYGFSKEEMKRVAEIEQLDLQQGYDGTRHPVYYLVKALYMVYGLALNYEDREKFEK